MEKPIRVLNMVPIMRAAGIENFIMNLYRHINRDIVQFDFIVHSKEEALYDKEIEALGGKIYRFTYKDDKNFIKYVKDLNHFFKEHKEYKIIHGNMQSMMPVYLWIAKKNGVPVCIGHSHNSDYEKTKKGFILHILSRFTKYISNVNFACSQEAAKYLFGKRNYEFIPNAIDVEKFQYNEDIRKQVREELDLPQDSIVIGHVGRFDLQKNHTRLIDIFYEVSKKEPKAVLCLLGEGKLEEQIKEKVQELNLQEKVKFLGVRKDTNRLYCAMDLFVLPSLYEGLPVVGIEAQTEGLSCLLSDSISKETNITGQVEYLPLDETNEVWAEKILQMSKKKVDRKQAYQIVKKTRFNIKENANYMQNLYVHYQEKGIEKCKR